MLFSYSHVILLIIYRSLAQDHSAVSVLATKTQQGEAGRYYARHG